MRTLIQRVQHASVTIDGQLKSKIGKGLLVLVTEACCTRCINVLISLF